MEIKKITSNKKKHVLSKSHIKKLKNKNDMLKQAAAFSENDFHLDLTSLLAKLNIAFDKVNTESMKLFINKWCHIDVLDPKKFLKSSRKQYMTLLGTKISIL